MRMAFQPSLPGASWGVGNLEELLVVSAGSPVTVAEGRPRPKIEQVLEPPPLLSNVAVVMVRTKRPVTIGTVARACECSFLA